MVTCVKVAHATYIGVVCHLTHEQTDLNMIGSKEKIKIKEFVDHISHLVAFAHKQIVDGFQENQKELLTKYLDDTYELIDNNEWGVGLENLLTNLYEIDFVIDQRTIELAFDALKSCGYELDKWKFIEELKTE